MKSQIQTSFVHPPIPYRGNDWCAYRDPEGLYGWGISKQDAIENLIENENNHD